MESNVLVKKPPISFDLAVLKKGITKKRTIENLINTEIDVRNDEKKKSAKTKNNSDSSDSEDEAFINVKAGKRATTKRKKRTPNAALLKAKKKEPDFMDEELKAKLGDLKKRDGAKVPKKSIDVGNKLTATGVQRYAADAPLSKFTQTYHRNSNKSLEQTKKDISGSISKQIDKSTEKLKAEDKKKKNLEEIEKKKAEFLDYDKNQEPFNLDNPFDYRMYQLLLAEFTKREELYLKEIRDSITKKLGQLKYPDLEICDKKYCQEYLREWRGKERPCRRDTECICMILATQPPESVEVVIPEEGFIAPEFLLPSERNTWEQRDFASDALPEEVGLCLLCKRLQMTFFYFYFIRNKLEPIEIIQDHQNKIDMVGEYSSEYCLCPKLSDSKTGIIAPVVKFAAHNYVFGKTYYKGELVRCLKEKNMEFFF
jgi:hypothetical protein